MKKPQALPPLLLLCFSLPSRGVYSISLSYKESARQDRFGNLFRGYDRSG